MTNFPMPPRSMSLDFIAFGVAAAAALVVLFVIIAAVMVPTYNKIVGASSRHQGQ